ncbi:MAG: hypothetical protein Ta2B_04470 [Termitinemataceae bacterium]|nr:MAG: hypothetical protein Ta2B_04470 [Termitinemataceae bacterium]
MNDGYVNADCIFLYLVEIGLIKKEKWKHNTKELYYPIHFYNATTNGSISFEIEVIDGKHCLTKSSVRCCSKLYGFNADIIKNCLIAN